MWLPSSMALGGPVTGWISGVPSIKKKELRAFGGGACL